MKFKFLFAFLFVTVGLSAQPRVREFVITERYVNIPVGEKSWGAVMNVSLDGVPFGIFTIDLQEENPFFWAFLDMQGHIGEVIRLEVDNCPTDLSSICNEDRIRNCEEIYSEALRPQVHFTTKRGWFNDPNGLVYYKGKYHLYYQYNPLSTFWGNMSWGHAESTDLVHWEEKTPVLYPLPSTGMCFTGAALVDKKNELGLKQGREDPIIAFYLRTGSGLSYAYSLDGGMTYTDYPGNPIVAKAVGRERIDSPKPIFHKELGIWVAPVFDDRVIDDRNNITVSLYVSHDLKTWTKTSDIGEVGIVAECPDLFPLRVKGKMGETRWVLMLGNAAYVTGYFDGTHFICEQTGKPVVPADFKTSMPFGNYYAPMTFSNIPGCDGRRIQIGWMKGDVFDDAQTFSGMPFNSQMSLPLVLTLHESKNGPRLHMYPVRETRKLRDRIITRKDLEGRCGRSAELAFTAHVGNKAGFGVDVKGEHIQYDASSRILSVRGQEIRVAPKRGKIKMRIFTDSRSIEIFVNDGEVFVPLLSTSETDTYSVSGDATIKRLRVYSLKDIWKQ